MHEMGIAMEVVKIAAEEAAKAGAKRVKALKMRIGKWSGVETESLRFALETVTHDTIMEGCAVEIEPVEPAFACDDCGVPYEADDRFDPCPNCGGPGGEMIAGDEMMLTEIDIEDGDDEE